MPVWTDSHHQVAADDAAAHPTGYEEAEPPEHAPFRGSRHPLEEHSQPLSQRLVERHLPYVSLGCGLPPRTRAAAGTATSRPSTTVTAIQSVN